jgi:adhesin transport system outer membrane protein
MRLQAFFKALLCCLLASTQAIAATGSLQDVIRTAAVNAPALQAIASVEREAQSALDIRSARLLPRLEMQSSIGRFYADTPSARQFGQSGHGLMAVRTELSLRQTLPFLSSVSEERNAARHHLVVAEAQGKFRYQQWMLTIVDSYIALHEARSLQALAMKNEQQHENAHAIVEQRQSAGRDNAASLAQSRARLALARSIVRERDSELLSALADYQARTGIAGDKLTLPQEDLITLPATLDDALALALRRHPLLAESKAATQRERASFSAAKRRYLPTVDLELSGAHSSDSPRHSFVDGGGREFDYFIGLRLRWDLYSGGEKRAAIAAADARLGATHAETGLRKIEIKSAVQRSYERLQGLINAGAALETYVRNSASASDKTLQRYRLGRSSIAETLDSQVEHFQAQVALIRNEHNRLRQRFQLLFDCGVLDSFLSERS